MTATMPDWEPVLIMLLTFYLSAGVFAAVGMWWQRRTRKAQSTKLEIVRNAVDGLPDPDSTQQAPKARGIRLIGSLLFTCLLATVSYGGIYLLIRSAVQFIWPNLLPEYRRFADTALSLGLPLLFIWLILPLIERWIILAKPSQELVRWERVLWQEIMLARWIGILAAAVATPIIVINQHGWLVAITIYAVFYFSFVVLWWRLSGAVLQFPHSWVQSALDVADYLEALRRVQHLAAKLSQDMGILYMYGTVLLFAGRYAEAEQFLRQSLITAEKTGQFIPEILVNLGYALLRQGQDQAATRALEGAIMLNPRAGHAYAGLAEIYLQQAIEPQKALALTDDFIKKTTSHRPRDRTLWGAILGDEAWALALLGRHAEAERSLKQAFELTNRKFQPGLAGLHFRAGHVKRLRQDRQQATVAFQRAIELDSEGAFGQLSRQALQALGDPVLQRTISDASSEL